MVGRLLCNQTGSCIWGESFEVTPKENDTDPTNYDKAMNNNDVILWQGAMEAELKSIYSNRVWIL